MNISKLLDIKNGLELEGIKICYVGPVSQGILEEIGESVRSSIDTGVDSSIGEKVFSVFVEQVQNIMKYSSEVEKLDDQKEIRSGISIIGETKGKIYCVTGNKISNEIAENISVKLDKLKLMDKTELKIFYKEQMRKEPDPGSKGAGLGFIEMARKSSEPLEYHITKIDDLYSFFALKTIL